MNVFIGHEPLPCLSYFPKLNNKIFLFFFYLLSLDLENLDNRLCSKGVGSFESRTSHN